MTEVEFNELVVGDIIAVSASEGFIYLEEITDVQEHSNLGYTVCTKELILIDTEGEEYSTKSNTDYYGLQSSPSLSIYDNSYGSLEAIKTKILLGVYP